MSTEYPDLADYLAIAEAVTGIDVDVLMRSTKLDLADSALHAPQGGRGDQDFYPDFVDSPRTTHFSTATSGPLG